MTLLGLISIFGLSCSNPKKNNETEYVYLNNTLDSLLNATIEEGLSPGIGLAVVSGSDVLYSKAFGVKEIGKGQTLKTTDAFDFSSIVKTMVSTAVMKEIEAGNIELDNKAADYLEALKGKEFTPTVRHMLSHSSGIQFNEGNVQTGGLLKSGDLKLAFEPGTKLQYSNAAFYTLGKILQEQSGKTLEEYVETQILASLAMTHSSIHTFKGMSNLTVPHTLEESKLKKVPRPEIVSRKIGNGIFYSTIEDMSIWAQMHLNKGIYKNRRVLASSNYTEIWKPNLKTGWDEMKAAAGLGWFIGTVDGRKTASHIGGTSGYSAALVIFPEDDRAIVIAGNSNKLPREVLIQSVASIVFSSSTN